MKLTNQTSEVIEETICAAIRTKHDGTDVYDEVMSALERQFDSEFFSKMAEVLSEHVRTALLATTSTTSGVGISDS